MIRHRLQSRRADGGFTLVELMVVVLIIGILLAIAIPTFLGARSRSQDSAAKTSLRNALTAAGVIYTDDESYDGADADALTATEGSISFVDSPTASDDAEEVSVAAGETWSAAALSESGTCFMIKTTATGTVTYGSASSGACTGAAADTGATDSEW